MSRTEIIAFFLHREFSARYRGFSDLVEVLSFCTDHPEKLHSITDVYRSVGEACGISAARIEHNIRYLLEARHMASGRGFTPRPSNKIVIRRLTLELLSAKKSRGA